MIKSIERVALGICGCEADSARPAGFCVFIEKAPNSSWA
jgi:hypothetical protein